MDKEVLRDIKALQRKAKKEKWVGPKIKDVRTSLDYVINTKEKADRFMKRLKELSKEKP